MYKYIFLTLLSVSFSVNAQSMAKLLIDNIEADINQYTCHVATLDSEEFKEIAICVKGKNIRAIELINAWVNNLSTNNKNKERVITKANAKELVIGSTYVMSIKAIDIDSSEKNEFYMTAFCSECKGMDSVSLLDDKSSLIFNSLSKIASK